jgi:hypothetical protein
MLCACCHHHKGWHPRLHWHPSAGTVWITNPIPRQIANASSAGCASFSTVFVSFEPLNGLEFPGAGQAIFIAQHAQIAFIAEKLQERSTTMKAIHDRIEEVSIDVRFMKDQVAVLVARIRNSGASISSATAPTATD